MLQLQGTPRQILKPKFLLVSCTKKDSSHKLYITNHRRKENRIHLACKTRGRWAPGVRTDHLAQTSVNWGRGANAHRDMLMHT